MMDFAMLALVLSLTGLILTLIVFLLHEAWVGRRRRR